ncbi:MarR family transcriptional regulator [Allokutzneria sp. NRRL B-24872]|uniref:MarR family transcriptional regulator n=1 Tax=Allokutzneria sp. NRRL B-24872 TaxID=1137961 RepID=UPI00117831ED|nr:MarR family transcriptional regulator [Allokutzneria sp. NRRL B-24872]
MLGNPGGLFHLRGGLVTAVESPGSPGAEALLLRSGRVSEQDWTAALREGTGTRSHQETLIARGAVGARELNALITVATRDGAFATAAGEIEDYVVDSPLDVLLSTSDGVAPDLLASETERRLDALAAMPFPLSPYRERVVPGSRAGTRALTDQQRTILEHATGRRTARDIAFVISRGVYPVTVEISRMLTEGMVEIASPEVSFGFVNWGHSSLHPRARPERGASPETEPEPLPARHRKNSRNRTRPSRWPAPPEVLDLSETEGKNIGL